MKRSDKKYFLFFFLSFLSIICKAALCIIFDFFVSGEVQVNIENQLVLEEEMNSEQAQINYGDELPEQ